MHCWFVCFSHYGVYGYLLGLHDHGSPHEPEHLFLATFICKQDIHPQNVLGCRQELKTGRFSVGQNDYLFLYSIML